MSRNFPQKKFPCAKRRKKIDRMYDLDFPERLFLLKVCPSNLVLLLQRQCHVCVKTFLSLSMMRARKCLDSPL